jgi:ribosomal protein L17
MVRGGPHGRRFYWRSVPPVDRSSVPDGSRAPLPLRRRECLASGKSFSALANEHIKGVLAKTAKVRNIVDSTQTLAKKVEALEKHIQIGDVKSLEADLERHGINKQRIEEAELEEIQVNKCRRLSY